MMEKTVMKLNRRECVNILLFLESLHDFYLGKENDEYYSSRLKELEALIYTFKNAILNNLK